MLGKSDIGINNIYNSSVFEMLNVSARCGMLKIVFRKVIRKREIIGKKGVVKYGLEEGLASG